MTVTPGAPTPFIVRLVMKVEGDLENPASGVLNFVDLLTANGLREWVYRVENMETGEILGYYDGWGDEVDMSGTVAAVAAADEGTPTPAPASEPVPESDESLVAYAESLDKSPSE